MVAQELESRPLKIFAIPVFELATPRFYWQYSISCAASSRYLNELDLELVDLCTKLSSFYDSHENDRS